MAKISIIIPTLNEGKHLEKCLNSISTQGYKGYEVIVVDGHSKDNTSEVARKYKAKLLTEEPRGAGSARNKGIKEAKGEILAFIDADSILPDGWLKRLEKDYEDKEVVAVAGPLVPTSEKIKHRFMYFFMTNLSPTILSLFKIFLFQGPNMSLRKSVFDEMGGFNVNLRSLEDNELGNRAKRYGKVLWDRNLWVYNSPRRFEDLGYFKQTMRYWNGFLRINTSKERKLDYKPYAMIKE